ncbi:DNA-directed RNA polymerase, mitochondrial [Candida viswanathii]|uniref:DNA-directed RNA polymerase n=1 Tax=Candida viswanathii TaxID=5486 RepID=A0A367YHJ4_9ASCO|nr:DNA-directed RNA polymerase, mitochondrial [Candida viswanathii]
MKADKPFGALSVCFEIKNILDFEAAGNRIEDYLCRLPIHQDGSCNGLQHYAALAADESGGKAVNLVQVGDSKQDVYVQVMEKVRLKIEEDIKDPTQTERAHSLAQFFLKILSRKLVKRPVMTTVYGVTLSGASAQIKSTIKEILEDHRTNPQKAVYDQQTLERLSALSLSDTTYLAKKVLDSISELFAHAKQIEEWLLQNTRRMLTSYSVHLLDYLEANNPKLYETIYTRPVSFRP